MRTLVIVESPGKVARLQALFGGIRPGYRVVATGGHICDLPDDWKPEPPVFVPQYELTERGRDAVQRLRAEVEKADRIILATDADREGEAIASHLARELGLQNPERIEIRSIDPDAVRVALASLHGIHHSRVEAQQARRILDRAIGYGLSGAMPVRHGRPMRFGRVQLPAVRLVVERDDDIRQFKPVHHYRVRLHFAGGWHADWCPDAPHFGAAGLCTNATLAARVAALGDLVVTNPEDTQEVRVAPAPFDTVSLIAAADSELGLSPAETMAAAQTLFEGGAISYHRTDSCTLSANAKHKLVRYCAAAGLAVDPADSDAGVSDPNEAHEAIRPNDFAVLAAGSTPLEQALYRLIWARSVASGMANGIDAVTRVTLRGVEPRSQRTVHFSACRETRVREGWRAVYNPACRGGGGTNSSGGAINPIPILFVPQHVQPVRSEVLNGNTQPPPRFRAATLIAELARRGIGRPSTYVTTLAKLIDDKHRFLTEDGDGFLTAKRRGITLVETLVGQSRFIEYDYTQEMETKLDAVERGQRVYEDVVGAGWNQLATDIAKLHGKAP